MWLLKRWLDMLDESCVFAWTESTQKQGSEEACNILYDVALDTGLLWNAWSGAGYDYNNGSW